MIGRALRLTCARLLEAQGRLWVDRDSNPEPTPKRALLYEVGSSTLLFYCYFREILGFVDFARCQGNQDREAPRSQVAQFNGHLPPAYVFASTKRLCYLWGERNP